MTDTDKINLMKLAYSLWCDYPNHIKTCDERTPDMQVLDVYERLLKELKIDTRQTMKEYTDNVYN